MNIIAERILLKAGITKLEQELLVAIDTNASDRTILDIGTRLANVKDCYTQVLELLDIDSRTSGRTYTASSEIDRTTHTSIRTSVTNTQVMHTKPSIWHSLLNKAQ